MRPTRSGSRSTSRRYGVVAGHRKLRADDWSSSGNFIRSRPGGLRPAMEREPRNWRRQGSSVRDGSGSPVAVIEPDRLYPPVAGSQLPAGGLPGGPTTTVPTPFSELSRGLRGMRFYSLGLDELREPMPKSAHALLGHQGEHLADVVGTLVREHREYKERLDAYLAAVLGTAEPGGTWIEQWFSGPPDEQGYTFVQLHSRVGVADQEVVFGPTSMSDGTIRAAGGSSCSIPASRSRRPGFTGRIEEPEAALHPAAACTGCRDQPERGPARPRGFGPGQRSLGNYGTGPDRNWQRRLGQQGDRREKAAHAWRANAGQPGHARRCAE